MQNKFLLVRSKEGGLPKISFLGSPQVGEKQCMEKESQSVLTMASYECHHASDTDNENMDTSNNVAFPIVAIQIQKIFAAP